MSRIVSQTRSYCPQCQTTHEAQYTEISGQVWYVIDCPKQTSRTRVSSDASLYQDIRHKAGFSGQDSVSFALRRPMSFMEITDACNFNCPVCYAQSGTHGQNHLSLDDIRKRLGQLREAGVRWVTLTGGDPTMHPHLEQVIRMTRRDFGLKPILLTNGLRLAQEPDLPQQLKRAGLGKVQLQFDTFDNDTYRLLRGRDDVQEKQDAVANIIKAGLRLGLVTTVCSKNLPELGAILAYAVSLSPALNSMIFQSVVPIGRYPADIAILDRETLIHALAEQSTCYDLHPSDFWPTPPMPVWGMAVHPDCPVNLHMLVKAEDAQPIGRQVDLTRFFEVMGRQKTYSPIRASFHPIAQLLRHTRSGRRISLMRHLYGMGRGKGQSGIIWVSVGGYMNADTRDEQRLTRCPGCSATANGVAGVCERSCNGQTRPLVAQEIAS